MKAKVDEERVPVLMIAGPTASGKTALALRICENGGLQIINGDSQQLYKGLPILTAQPSAQDFEKVPHHLYGAFPPEVTVSAWEWCKHVVDCITTCHSQGHMPVIVGGTGFYLKALIHGLSPVPSLQVGIASEAAQRVAREGTTGLLAELYQAHGPDGISGLNPNDAYRVIRAWGTWKSTGQLISFFRALPREKVLEGLHIFSLTLLPERDTLYARINRRFEEMVESGAMEEVAAFQTLPHYSDLAGFKALGARQIDRYLKGEISKQEAICEGQKESRHYAKRQITWFRHQHPATLSLQACGEDIEIPQAVRDFLRGALTGF